MKDNKEQSTELSNKLTWEEALAIQKQAAAKAGILVEPRRAVSNKNDNTKEIIFIKKKK